jgi:hypothetical protein
MAAYPFQDPDRNQALQLAAIAAVVRIGAFVCMWGGVLLGAYLLLHMAFPARKTKKRSGPIVLTLRREARPEQDDRLDREEAAHDRDQRCRDAGQAAVTDRSPRPIPLTQTDNGHRPLSQGQDDLQVRRTSPP